MERFVIWKFGEKRLLCDKERENSNSVNYVDVFMQYIRVMNVSFILQGSFSSILSSCFSPSCTLPSME